MKNTANKVLLTRDLYKSIKLHLNLFIESWTYVLSTTPGSDAPKVSNIVNDTELPSSMIFEPDAIITLYKPIRFKRIKFICLLQNRWHVMEIEGPEIFKFLTFAKDEVPDTCKHATYINGKFSNDDCNTIKWSADGVAKENRLNDRLVSRLDGATYSLYGQRYACFDQPSNDSTRVEKFNIIVN